MRTRTLVVAFCVAAAGTAAAQPPPPSDPPTEPPPQPEPPQPQPPTVPPPTNVPPPTVVPQPAVEPAADNGRPTELSIGIGIGYQFPTSLETPNVTSVRFRLPAGLTFEPQVVLASTTQTVDTGMAVDNKTTELGLGTAIRYPLMGHGKVDLELLGAFNINNVKQNPPGDDDETSTTTTSITYGLAVSSWITRHWQISLTAANPVLSFVKVRQEMGVANVLVQSQTTIGAIFDPTVQLMVHLYH